MPSWHIPHHQIFGASPFFWWLKKDPKGRGYIKKMEKNQKTNANNLPEKKFRAGPVSVTVWKNQAIKETGEPVEYQTISMERSYKDKTGVWQSTNSLRTNDLPRAAIALQKAYEYIVLSA